MTETRVPVSAAKKLRLVSQRVEDPRPPRSDLLTVFQQEKLHCFDSLPLLLLLLAPGLAVYFVASQLTSPSYVDKILPVRSNSSRCNLPRFCVKLVGLRDLLLFFLFFGGERMMQNKRRKCKCPTIAVPGPGDRSSGSLAHTLPALQPPSPAAVLGTGPWRHTQGKHGVCVPLGGVVRDMHADEGVTSMPDLPTEHAQVR